MVPARVFEALKFCPSVYKPQVSRILDDIRDSAYPRNLCYWHVILPHAPYVFNPDGTKHDRTGSQTENYRKQTQFVDVLLGQFVALLKTEGLYAESVFVVTTDHGLLSGCPCTIPLFIRAPGLSSGVSDVSYSQVDFLPTLVDLLGLPPIPDDRLVGKSVFASGSGGPKMGD